MILANKSVFRFVATGVCLLVGCLVQADTPSQAEKIDWVKEHAVPIRSVDISDDDYSDLMPLVDKIGTARIVQLGEATHGDGTTFEAKARLVRFLHEVMGFNVIAWESSHYGLKLADAGMRDHSLSTYAAVRDKLFGIWAESQEVNRLFDYVRSTQSTAEPIRMAGVDCHLGSDYVKAEFPKYIFSFLDRVNPKLFTAEDKDNFTKACVRISYSAYYTKTIDEDFSMEPFHKLLAYLDKGSDELIRSASPSEVQYIRRALIDQLAYKRFSETAHEQGNRPPSRDQVMGEHLVWLANEVYPDEKIIVWAHNWHIMEGLYTLQTKEQFDEHDKLKIMSPMGRVAHLLLGSEVYTIGFAGYQGAWRLANHPETLHEIPAASEDSMDWYLNHVASPYSFLDLSHLPEGHWLSEPIPGRYYAWHDRSTLWSRVYDAVFFSREMKPATPMVP